MAHKLTEAHIEPLGRTIAGNFCLWPNCRCKRSCEAAYARLRRRPMDIKALQEARDE